MQGFEAYNKNFGEPGKNAAQEWKPQTREHQILDSRLGLDNIDAFIEAAVPKAIVEADPLTMLVPAIQKAQPQLPPAPPPQPAVQVVEFETDGVKFRVEGTSVYKKAWVDVTDDGEYKTEDERIYHLEWTRVN